MCRDTDWTDEEDVLVLAQEVEAEEGLHLAAIDLDWPLQSKPSSTTRSSKPACWRWRSSA